MKLILGAVIGFLACLALALAGSSAGVVQVTFPDTTGSKPPVYRPGVVPAELILGKAEIKFQKFEYGKEWNAHFEIINGTSQPISYVGRNQSPTSAFCSLIAKRELPNPANHDGKEDNRSFQTDYGCYDGKYARLEEIGSGESTAIAIADYTVRRMLSIEDPNKATVAQIGFEIFAGDKKQRQILWSEEITFPPDPARPGVPGP